MNNYENLSIETYDGFDNLTFLPEMSNGDISHYDIPGETSNRSPYSNVSFLDIYGYTGSGATSELGSVKDMESTVKLVTPKLQVVSNSIQFSY